LQLVYLYKDPKGETVLDPSPVGTNVDLTTIHKTVTTIDHDDEVTKLKRRLTEMEKKLADVQVFVGNLF